MIKDIELDINKLKFREEKEDFETIIQEINHFLNAMQVIYDMYELPVNIGKRILNLYFLWKKYVIEDVNKMSNIIVQCGKCEYDFQEKDTIKDSIFGNLCYKCIEALIKANNPEDISNWLGINKKK